MSSKKVVASPDRDKVFGAAAGAGVAIIAAIADLVTKAFAVTVVAVELGTVFGCPAPVIVAVVGVGLADNNADDAGAATTTSDLAAAMGLLVVAVVVAVAEFDATTAVETALDAEELMFK